MECKYKIGEKVKFVDDILGCIIGGTILFIEYDISLNLYWLYLASDNDDDNVIIDNKFPGKYFKMIPDNDEFLVDEEDE